MKVVIILCLVALALAEDNYNSYHPQGHPLPYYRPQPRYHRPGHNDNHNQVIEYHYDIDYPEWLAKQGKLEKVDINRIIGSYHVQEPRSSINVKYYLPKSHHHH